MTAPRMMRRFARWHLWLGWLTGVPLVLWTLSGLVMTLRPIEEVRGSDRLVEAAPVAFDPAAALAGIAAAGRGGGAVTALSVRSERGATIVRATRADGTTARFRADGTALPPLSQAEARAIVAQGVRGGAGARAVRRFAAADSPADFRRPVDSWQVTLADGTHVYVGIDSGEIEAVRTRWWRVYDVLWGLHIMDLQTREDTHNPFVITFAALALAGSLLGCVLLFRRRKARVVAA